MPGMIAGELTNTFDLLQIAAGYAALGIVASIIAVLAVTRSSPRQSAHGG